MCFIALSRISTRQPAAFSPTLRAGPSTRRPAGPVVQRHSSDVSFQRINHGARADPSPALHRDNVCELPLASTPPHPLPCPQTTVGVVASNPGMGMFSPAGTASLAAVTLALLTVVLCSSPGKIPAAHPGRAASSPVPGFLTLTSPLTWFPPPVCTAGCHVSVSREHAARVGVCGVNTTPWGCCCFSRCVVLGLKTKTLYFLYFIKCQNVMFFKYENKAFRMC